MTGYYKIDMETIKLLQECVNVEKNNYYIPDIVVSNDKLPRELILLYEMFSISTIKSSELEILDHFVEEEKTDFQRRIHYLLQTIYDVESRGEKNPGHSLRVAMYAYDLATQLNLPDDKKRNIYFAGLFHDIGKNKISLDIISKHSSLTDEEYRAIKSHPLYSYEILKGLFNDDVLEMIIEHHERENGKGYPLGIKPVNIGSKILAIADSYDAMTSERVYGITKTNEEALSELVNCTCDVQDGGKGILYDRQLVKRFVLTRRKTMN